MSITTSRLPPFAVHHSLHQTISFRKKNKAVIAEVTDLCSGKTTAIALSFSKLAKKGLSSGSPKKDVKNFLSKSWTPIPLYSEKENVMQFTSELKILKPPFSPLTSCDLLPPIYQLLKTIKIKILEGGIDYRQDLICPLSLDLFDNPHTDTCGHTFTLAEIETWLKDSNICPLSRKEITRESLVPSLILKNQAEEEKEKFPVPTPGLFNGKSIQQNERKAQIFLNSAKEWMRDNEYEEVLKQYKSVLMHTNSSEMYALLPPFIEAQGKNLEAAYSYLCLAFLQTHENKQKAASRNIEKALSLLPEDEAFASSRGLYYFKTGEIKKAIHSYDLLAKSYTEKQINEAIASHEKAILSHPDDLVHYLKLASLYDQPSDKNRIYLSIISRFGHVSKEIAEKVYYYLLENNENNFVDDLNVDLDIHLTYLSVLDKKKYPDEVMDLHRVLAVIYREKKDYTKWNYYYNKRISFKKLFEAEQKSANGGNASEVAYYPYSKSVFLTSKSQSSLHQLLQLLYKDINNPFCSYALKDPALKTVLSLKENEFYLFEIFELLADSSELLEKNKFLVMTLFNIIKKEHFEKLLNIASLNHEVIFALMEKCGMTKFLTERTYLSPRDFINEVNEKTTFNEYLINQIFEEIVLGVLRNRFDGKLHDLQKKINRLAEYCIKKTSADLKQDLDSATCQLDSKDIISVSWKWKLNRILQKLSILTKVLSDKKVDINKAYRECLKPLVNLEELTIVDPENFFDKWGEFLNGFKKLRSLSIEIMDSPDSLLSVCEGIRKYVPQLEHFCIINSRGKSTHKMDSQVLKNICEMKNLKVLDIRETSFDSYSEKKPIPDLSLLTTFPSLEKIYVNSYWFYQKPELKKDLAKLIKKGVDVHFDYNTSKELVRGRGIKMFNSKLEYWAPSRKGLQWWEKAYFHHVTANTTREDLIEKVKIHLTKNQIDFAEWEKFIETAKDFQLASLLHKDAYYLGKLDDDAASYDPDGDFKKGSYTPTNPSKVKQLITYTCLLDLLNRFYMSARSLVLKDCADYQSLRSLRHYIHLEDLQFTSLKDSSLDGMPILPKLKSLSLCQGDLTTENMHTICQMPKLEKLKFEKTQLMDLADLMLLANLKCLKELHVPGEWSQEEIFSTLQLNDVKICFSEFEKPVIQQEAKSVALITNKSIINEKDVMIKPQVNQNEDISSSEEILDCHSNEDDFTLCIIS